MEKLFLHEKSYIRIPLNWRNELNQEPNHTSVNIFFGLIKEISKAWFSYVGKIPDGLGFYCFLTVPDFAD